MFRRAALALAATLAACATPPGPAANPPGATAGGTSGQQTANLPGAELTVFTWHPTGCQVSAILLVFHGVDRNAGPYRDDAIPLAQRDCMAVVAPLFDEPRFPASRYQRGGITRGGTVLPGRDWTINLVPQLVAWERVQENRPDLPYVLLGHSAGAQFLSRVAAYGEGGARRIVIANPSTWVRPSLDIAAPYGFGGIPDGEAALRRYLAAPIRVLLGQNDTGSRNLATSDEAEEQGANRLERGQTAFHEAEATARSRGWPFGWTLAIVPGAGHNARRMFTSDAAFAAVAPGP